MAKRKGADSPGQMKIDWDLGNVATAAGATSAAQPPLVKSAPAESRPLPAPLVQKLPWDFRESFPQPLDAAIEAGVLDESDLEPANLRSLHEDYATQCLAALVSLDKALDARRRGVDPSTQRVPRSADTRERLRRYLTEESGRLERTFTMLMETYADAFGTDAAEAFTQAIRARHAGIEVVADPALLRHQVLESPASVASIESTNGRNQQLDSVSHFDAPTRPRE